MNTFVQQASVYDTQASLPMTIKNTPVTPLENVKAVALIPSALKVKDVESGAGNMLKYLMICRKD
jgi:hypothetical protein